MEHTLFVNGNESAVIIEYHPHHYEVTAYVNGRPSVAWETTTYRAAEAWAKAVIAYPA